MELKSGATLAPDFLRNPVTFAERVASELPNLRPVRRLVYGGDTAVTRSRVEVIPWQKVQIMVW